MAIMIPANETMEDFNQSLGEMHLSERLKQLPDDYYIFHSARWNERYQRTTNPRRKYVDWREADFLVYDATIDHVDSLDDIIDRNAMFANFKAFEEGNVWVMEGSLYQNSNEVGTIVSDIHNMLTGEGETVHLRKLGNN